MYRKDDHKKEIYTNHPDQFDYTNDMKSPSTTATTTRTMTMMIMMASWFMIFSASSTMACRCFTEPTLDVMLQDESISIFHGIIVSHRSLLSPSNDNDGKLSNEYTVLIQKVYKNACPDFGSAANPNSTSSSLPPLRAYQTITVASPQNSCGVSSLTVFRSFLFTGIVTYHDTGNNRARMLQEPDLPSVSTTNTTTMVAEKLSNHLNKKINKLRRTVSTEVAASMNVDLCSNYIQPWRAVPRTEKRQLSNYIVDTTRSKYCL
jgi:hypothetical protein